VKVILSIFDLERRAFKLIKGIALLLETNFIISILYSIGTLTIHLFTLLITLDPTDSQKEALRSALEDKRNLFLQRKLNLKLIVSFI